MRSCAAAKVEAHQIQSRIPWVSRHIGYETARVAFLVQETSKRSSSGGTLSRPVHLTSDEQRLGPIVTGNTILNPVHKWLLANRGKSLDLIGHSFQVVRTVPPDPPAVDIVVATSIRRLARPYRCARIHHQCALPGTHRREARLAERTVPSEVRFRSARPRPRRPGHLVPG